MKQTLHSPDHPYSLFYTNFSSRSYFLNIISRNHMWYLKQGLIDNPCVQTVILPHLELPFLRHPRIAFTSFISLQLTVSLWLSNSHVLLSPFQLMTPQLRAAGFSKSPQMPDLIFCTHTFYPIRSAQHHPALSVHCSKLPLCHWQVPALCLWLKNWAEAVPQGELPRM